jgi:membrane associated rhomboid family serine protease
MTFYKTSGPQLRICPVCGSQHPITEVSCPRCETIFPDAQQQAELLAAQQATDYRFLSALFNRSNPFTMIFIGINVGLYVLMCLAGGIAVTSVNPEVLIGFGAKQNDLIVNQHQYWRLVTSNFIHIGIIHLFFNNYALWIIGQEIERIYGSARFVVLYFLTGVIGSVGSFYFNPNATSAGASGAIFGLFGALATFAFRYRKEIPSTMSQEIKRRVLPLIAINLIFGFSVQFVDNSAHLGGLFSGIALAFVVPYLRPNENDKVLWRALQYACLILILIPFVEAFRSYNGPRLAFSNLIEKSGSRGGSLAALVEPYFNKMQEGRYRLRLSLFVDEKNLRQMKADDFKPAINALEDGIDKVSSAPRINDESDQYRTRLLELLAAQKSLLNEFVRSGLRDPAKFAKDEQQISERNDRFESDYSQWLPGFLKQFGYELKDRKGG